MVLALPGLPAHVEAALVEDHVGVRDLQQMRGELLRFGDDLLARDVNGHAADSQAAAAVRAVPERWTLGGVAVANLDRVVRHAQSVRRDLGKRGLVSLTMGMRPDVDLHRARRVDAYLR